MRRLVIGSTIALVTFAVGTIIATVLRTTPVAPESKQPAAQRVELHVEKPPEVKTDQPVAKVQQQTDLSIVVQISEHPAPSFRREDIKLAKPGPTVIDLDLTESIDGQEVILNFRGDEEYRVLQRYRTSMTVSEEGPHLDLVDWRHFDSPWVPLKALGSRRFRTLGSDQMDDDRFPAATNEEIVKEVRRRVGKDWPGIVELAKECRSPNDGACFVSISSMYLRIQKRLGDRWIDVGVVEIRIPMGC